MNANKIIFLRELRIFCRAFLVNFLLMLVLSMLPGVPFMAVLLLVSAIYFNKIKGTTLNCIIASLLFMGIVIPFSWTDGWIAVSVMIVLLVLLLKSYTLRECTWASWTLGTKLAFCLYIDGFDVLIIISFFWFMLTGLKEMEINKDEKPPYDFIPKNTK